MSVSLQKNASVSLTKEAGDGLTKITLGVGWDVGRARSVRRSHRVYWARTVFRTLAVPSIFPAVMSVLSDALAWSWMDVGMSMFVMVAIIFRLHHDKDEDNWWKGKGKKLARWARRQLSSGTSVAPAMG